MTSIHNRVEEALAPIRALTETCHVEIAEAQDRGCKVAGMFCIFAPEEMVRAAGMIPVPLCGKKNDPIAVAETDLPAALCPLIKSSYGFAKSGTCPFFAAADLVIGETTCDGKKKMFELLADFHPMHVMQLPYKADLPEAEAYWKSEMLRLKDRLETESGNTIDDATLSSMTRTLNKRREQLDHIARMMADPAPPITGSQMLEIAESRNFGIDLADYESRLAALTEILDAVRKEGGRSDLATRKRILVTGCPMGKGSDKILQLIEESGGLVVAQDQCYGIKGIYRQVAEEGDIFDNLTRYYLDTPCACMSPGENRMRTVGELAAFYKADAIIDAGLLNCHPYNTEFTTLSRKVGEKAGYPCLHLETDFSPSDTESLRIRIEAFLEML